MSLQEVNLGRIIFMWKSDWEENKQYYLCDIVRVEKWGCFFVKLRTFQAMKQSQKKKAICGV